MHLTLQHLFLVVAGIGLSTTQAAGWPVTHGFTIPHVSRPLHTIIKTSIINSSASSTKHYDSQLLIHVRFQPSRSRPLFTLAGDIAHSTSSVSEFAQSIVKQAIKSCMETYLESGWDECTTLDATREIGVLVPYQGEDLGDYSLETINGFVNFSVKHEHEHEHEREREREEIEITTISTTNDHDMVSLLGLVESRALAIPARRISIRMQDFQYYKCYHVFKQLGYKPRYLDETYWTFELYKELHDEPFNADENDGRVRRAGRRTATYPISRIQMFNRADIGQGKLSVSC